MGPMFPRPGEIVVVALSKGPIIARCVEVAKGRVAVDTTRNKIARIPADRVIATLGSTNITDADLEEVKQAAVRIADELDLTDLWELAASEGTPISVTDAAGLVFGAGPGMEHVGGAAIALEVDDLHFRRVDGCYLAQTPQEVEDTIARRRAAERRAAERTVAIETLLAGEAPNEDSIEARRLIAELRSLIVAGDDAPSKGGAGQVLSLIPPGPGEPRRRAFELLVAASLMKADEPIEIEGAGFSPQLPREAEEDAAQIAAADWHPEGRSDLTSLPTVTVDTAGTTDRDDALSAEELDDGRVRVWAHITDVTSLIPPGGPVDAEARLRMATLYTPDLRAPMVPTVLGEKAGSITPGRPVRAVSIAATIDEAGDVADCEISLSVIVSDDALSYADADRILESGEGPVSEVVRRLSLAAGWLRERRIRDGAIMIERPDVSIRLEPGNDGRPRPSIEVYGFGSAARQTVTEMMVLCNRLIASRCAELGIAAIYRVQEEPAAELQDPVPGATAGYDPVAAYRMAGLMAPARLSTQVGRHHGLAIEAYLQATSPLRRFVDLANQRQLVAHLAGFDEPHSTDELAMIGHEAEVQLREIARVEASRRRYWMIRFLEMNWDEGRTDYEAIVLEPERPGRPSTLELTAFPMRVRTPIQGEGAAGDRLMLRLVGLDTWRRTVRLKAVQ